YNSLWVNIIISLPNNQWQIEVTNWHNIALAKFQDWIVEYSRGPSTIRKGSVISEPVTKADRDLCSSQKVHQTSSHISFSLLGLLIVLVFGGSIIFASLFIDTLVGFFQRCFHISEHKAIQWALDEKLQLQRMVYEKAGIGSWNNCDGRVPTTTEEVRHMGVVVQDQDGKHPSYGKDADQYATDSLLERRELALLLETRQQEELKKGAYTRVSHVAWYTVLKPELSKRKGGLLYATELVFLKVSFEDAGLSQLGLSKLVSCGQERAQVWPARGKVIGNNGSPPGFGGI
ncbi:MAG: hypothetical protein Q9187_009149, partial [Circinaria calcarea]